MEKYLIALDLDGTLLNSKKEICPDTLKYLHHLDNLGHIIVIATGRPIRSIKRYYDELNLHSPIICYNGANIISPNNPTFKEVNFAFPKEIIKQIYNDVGPKYIENVLCETNKELWIIKDDETLESVFVTKGMKLIKGDIRETLTDDPMTMIIKSYSTSSNNILEAAVKKHPGLEIRFWMGAYEHYSEIFFSNVTKAHALADVAKLYNINRDHIIAFGDANNDIQMFQFAGISVAMKNANDNLKKYATRVSKFDNDHDGIMYELKSILKDE